MTTIPHTVDDLSASWLADVLGANVTDARFMRIAEGTGLLSEIYRAELVGQGVPDSVVVKISSPNPEARQSAATYRMYEREIRFFELLASKTPVRSPEALHAAWNPETEDSVIVMEDLSRLRPGDQDRGLTQEDAAVALNELAALHARWWGDDALAEMTWAGTLLDPTYYVGIPAGYEMLLPLAKQHYAHVLEPVMPVLERLHPHINRVQERLCSGPNTLLHGDFRCDNIMYGIVPDDPAAVIVDWQAVVIGRAGQDLGYFLGQSLTVEDRRRHERELLQGYVDALARGGVQGYSFDDCWEEYRYSLLNNVAYGVLMAGLDVNDEPTFRKVEMILQRLSAAADDVGVADLVN